MKAAYAKRSPEDKPITKGNYLDLKYWYYSHIYYLLMSFLTQIDTFVWVWFLFSLSRCETQSDTYHWHAWEEGKEIKLDSLILIIDILCSSMGQLWFFILFITLIHMWCKILKDCLAVMVLTLKKYSYYVYISSYVHYIIHISSNSYIYIYKSDFFFTK